MPFMKTFFRSVLLAPLLGGLAGCCANSANTCDDLQADSLYLALAYNKVDGDTVNVSFTRAELDTVYLQRYAPARPAQPAVGTQPAQPAQPEGTPSASVSIVRASRLVTDSARVRRLRAAKLTPSTTLIISNTVPFSPSTTGGKLNAYNYILTIADRSVKPRKTYVYKLTNIVLQGRYEADGCTTCYENTKKEVTLTGLTTHLPFPATETTVSNGVKVPVPLRISKLD